MFRKCSSEMLKINCNLIYSKSSLIINTDFFVRYKDDFMLDINEDKLMSYKNSYNSKIHEHLLRNF